MTDALTLSGSIHVAAAPDEVYAVVSDVTRTGEWSPICRACWWDAGDGPRVGARFTGRNETPDRTWQTTSVVIAAEPGRHFAWSVADGVATWGYRIAPSDGGALLTEYWEFTPEGQQRFVERYGDDAPRQVADRQEAARSGIPATLAAIKQVIEAG